MRISSPDSLFEPSLKEILMQPLFGLQSSFSTHLARNSVFHSRFAANTGEYFRSQMIRSTKRSLIDSLSLSLFYDLRQRQSSESKRPGISVFLPSERARGRGSDGGGGGGGRGTEEHEFYKGGGSHSSSNPSLYPFRHTILTERYLFV